MLDNTVVLEHRRPSSTGLTCWPKTVLLAIGDTHIPKGIALASTQKKSLQEGSLAIQRERKGDKGEGRRGLQIGNKLLSTS